MYAVIETGGKQYRVEVGTELSVELLDVEPGKTVTLDRVLLIADGDTATIGRPMVDGAAVSAEVVRQARGDKVISFKYRPKARSRVKKGHRQELTILRINDIVVGGKSAAKTAAKAGSDAKTERQRLEDAAVEQAAKDATLAAELDVASTTDAAKSPKKATSAKAATKATGAKAASKSTAKAATDADAADGGESKAETAKTPSKKSPSTAMSPSTAKSTSTTKSTSTAKPKPSAADAADIADADGSEPAARKSAPKRATKKDE
jgi:large subunit ribosomal protein L21